MGKFRSISAMLLVCCLLAVSLPTTTLAADEVLSNSGSTSMKKLSKVEMGRLLENNPLTLSGDLFDTTPSTSAPYATGSVKTSALQAATDRLNALRRIAGLPSVTLDASLCENAQYGAVILAAMGGLSHTPEKLEDMDDSFYQQALTATSSSNLAAGYTLTGAVDGLMDDSDASNISRVGHRRWQLNPTLGKVGFGYATSNTLYRTYVAEKVFDKSGAAVDYDFISWPSSGNFPNDLSAFTRYTPWSVTLNPSKYETPVQADITVTLTRQSDGKEWSFSGSEYSATSTREYFHVDTGNYGVSNCIIFRPEGVSSYSGVYTVHIEGLKTRQGQAAELTYQVDFFNSAYYRYYDDPLTFTAQYSADWAGAVRQSTSGLIVTLTQTQTQTQTSSAASPIVYLATYTADGQMDSITQMAAGDEADGSTIYTTTIPTSAYKIFVLDQADHYTPMIVAYSE